MQIKYLIQKIFNRFGLQVRRITRDVSFDSALEEQLRLAGDHVRTIFEVGAADGMGCTIYAARCPNATVYAFEPLPSSFAKLMAYASHEPRIVPINCAVSDRAGRGKFHITALKDASSLLPPRNTGSTFDASTRIKTSINVDIIDLGSYCKKSHIEIIDLLKMDAQGNELRILKGAAELLQAGKIAVIYSEVNFIEIYEGCAIFREIETYLDSMGYELHNIYNLNQNQNGKLAWADAIFVRKAGS